MRQPPTIWSLQSLVEWTTQALTQIDGKWVPKRPMGGVGLSDRIKAAWLVFTGKADAVIWPEDQ